MPPQVYNPRHQCRGKIRFPTKADAKRCAKAWEQGYGRMRPYRCVWCGWIHLGHRVPKPSKLKRLVNAAREREGPGAAVNCPGLDRSERA